MVKVNKGIGVCNMLSWAIQGLMFQEFAWDVIKTFHNFSDSWFY